MEAVKPVNSNSCESKATELTLVKTSTLPVIPSIKFVATKGSEVEEFVSFKSLESWFIDECDKEICEAYSDADRDSTGGCDGPYDWVKNTFYFKEIEEFLGDKGWELKKVQS